MPGVCLRGVRCVTATYRDAGSMRREGGPPCAEGAPMSAEVTAIVREATAGSRVRRSPVRGCRFDVAGDGVPEIRVTNSRALDMAIRLAPVGL